MRDRPLAVAHTGARGRVLRLPVRANMMFRLKSLLMAGAAVLATRIAAALFAKR
jgi:hypothetical protein